MNITINSSYINTKTSFTARKINISKEQILKLRESGLSENKIIENLGISTACYYKHLKALGIDKKLSIYNNELSKIPKDKFEEMLKNHFSINDICKFFKITTTAYYNLLEKFNLRQYILGANSKKVTNELLQELVDKDVPIKEICERLNITESVYYVLVKKLNIQTKYKKNKMRTSEITKEELSSLIESGKTYPEIIKILGISQPTLQRLIGKFKIETQILKTKSNLENITKENLENLIKSGKKVDEICKELNISRRNYSTLVNRFGIMTEFRKNKAAMANISKEELQKLVDKGMTVNELCKHFNFSDPSAIYRLFKKLNINYNYKHHYKLKEIPKNKLEQVVSDWQSQNDIEEKLNISPTAFYIKTKEAKVETIMSGSLKKLNSINIEEVQKYLDEGATTQEICEMYDITPNMYQSLLRKYNLQSPGKKIFDNAKKITKEQIEQLINSKKTLNEVSQELNISNNTLFKKMRDFGIDRKKTSNR